MNEIYIEIFGVIAGLLYVSLQIKQHPYMWIVGFITAASYIYVFFRSAVYANMLLQVYYVVASVYGFWMWKYHDAPKESAIIYRRLTPRLAAVVVVSIAALVAVCYYVLDRYTDSVVPLGDAFTAAMGIVATWMLAHRIIEHWLFWIVADSVSVYVCYHQGLYPSMFLYVCYTGLATAGYITWKRKGLRQYDSPI